MVPNIFRVKISKFIYVSFIILSAMFVVSGCVSYINELRDAQNHFNAAAMLENQLKTDPLSGNALAINTQANASYHLSLKILTELIDNKKQELRNDGLLGTAYTIKALAQWRIGQYDDAINTVSMVKADKDIKLFPRDHALINSLSGLIKNDQAYGHMIAKDYDYKSLKRLLLSSLEDIKVKTIDSGSMRLYLATAKLSVLKNWADLRGTPAAYTKENAAPPGFNKEAEIEEWCIHTVPAWEEFQDALKNIPTEKSDAISIFWGERLGMPEACPEK